MLQRIFHKSISYYLILTILVIAGCAPQQPLLPWEVREGESEDNYAYRRYSTERILETMNNPITDQSYIEFVKERASEFTLNGERFPVYVIDNAIIDAGGYSPNTSNTFAPIDLDRSKALLQYLEDKIEFTINSDYLFGFLHSGLSFSVKSSKEIGNIAYIYTDRLIVSVVSRDVSRVRLILIDDEGVSVLYDLDASSVPTDQEISEYLIDIDQLATEYYGGFKRILVKEGEEWTWKRLGSFEATNRIVEEGVVVRAAVGDVEAGEEDIDEVGQALVDLFDYQIYVGNSFYSRTMIFPAQDDEAEQPPSEETPEEEEVLLYGLPGGAGEWPCDLMCTARECRWCCVDEAENEGGKLIVLSVLCHIACFISPSCHAGCSTAVSLAAYRIVLDEAKCLKNCDKETYVPADRAPDCD